MKSNQCCGASHLYGALDLAPGRQNDAAPERQNYAAPGRQNDAAPGRQNDAVLATPSTTFPCRIYNKILKV
jgi:hypothetical protein